jgi:hypothetical protein
MCSVCHGRWPSRNLVPGNSFVFRNISQPKRCMIACSADLRYNSARCHIFGAGSGGRDVVPLYPATIGRPARPARLLRHRTPLYTVNLRNTTRDIVGQVEQRIGYPIEAVDTAALHASAVVHYACRETSVAHIVHSYSSSGQSPAYVAYFQCDFIFCILTISTVGNFEVCNRTTAAMPPQTSCPPTLERWGSTGTWLAQLPSTYTSGRAFICAQHLLDRKSTRYRLKLTPNQCAVNPRGHERVDKNQWFIFGVLRVWYDGSKYIITRRTDECLSTS